VILRVSANLLLVILILITGCNRDSGSPTGEHAYVVAPQVALRDRVAAVYNKVGFVNNGERVEVLDRSSNKRFIKVRTDDGKEGWLEQRFLASQATFDGFQRLADQNAASTSQAIAITKRVVNMHLGPARDADVLYQLKEGDKLELIKRASTSKDGGKAQAIKNEEDLRERESESGQTSKTEPSKNGNNISGKNSKANETVEPASILEDWWLVRDTRKHAGWVLGRMLDVDVPLEIAQYAEGQRIVASFVLNEVEDTAQNKKMPQYAVLMTPNKDGLPYDFDQMRIFTWNLRRSRYETAYHERFQGMLPFTLTKEPDKREGEIPVFSVRTVGKDGDISERKYKMYGVMVRKVK
jgi:uncharacterized protein YgiM (DUF1202 family)